MNQNDILDFSPDFMERFTLSIFSVCNHNRSIKIMLIMRIICFLESLSIFIFMVINSNEKRNFFFCFSHWSLILLIISYSLSSYITMIEYYKRNLKNPFKTLTKKKYYLIHMRWVAFNISTSINILLFFYWFLNRNHETKNILMSTFIIINNTLLILIELFFSLIPIKLSFFYQSWIFTFVYMIFYTHLNYYYDIKNIYNLNYDLYSIDRPLIWIYYIIIVIFLGILNFILYSIDYIKCEYLKIEQCFKIK